MIYIKNNIHFFISFFNVGLTTLSFFIILYFFNYFQINAEITQEYIKFFTFLSFFSFVLLFALNDKAMIKVGGHKIKSDFYNKALVSEIIYLYAFLLFAYFIFFIIYSLYAADFIFIKLLDSNLLFENKFLVLGTTFLFSLSLLNIEIYRALKFFKLAPLINSIFIYISILSLILILLISLNSITALDILKIYFYSFLFFQIFSIYYLFKFKLKSKLLNSLNFINNIKENLRLFFKKILKEGSSIAGLAFLMLVNQLAMIIDQIYLLNLYGDEVFSQYATIKRIALLIMFPVLLSFTSFRTSIVSINRDNMNGVSLRQKHQIITSLLAMIICIFFIFFYEFISDKFLNYDEIFSQKILYILSFLIFLSVLIGPTNQILVLSGYIKEAIIIRTSSLLILSILLYVHTESMGIYLIPISFGIYILINSLSSLVFLKKIGSSKFYET